MAEKKDASRKNQRDTLISLVDTVIELEVLKIDEKKNKKDKKQG